MIKLLSIYPSCVLYKRVSEESRACHFFHQYAHLMYLACLMYIHGCMHGQASVTAGLPSTKKAGLANSSHSVDTPMYDSRTFQELVALLHFATLACRVGRNSTAELFWTMFRQTHTCVAAGNNF